ncbi:MAG TPA: CSLREA domain-containing protein [Thermoleophilaceae bacterium]
MTRRRWTRCTLLALIALAALPAAASADPIAVNTTLDLVTDNDGLCSLREAVDSANADDAGDSGCADGSGADVITLGATEYQLARMGFDDDNTGGDLDTTGVGGLTIEGAGSSSTVINFVGHKDRVFHNASGRTLTLRDLTVTGGAAEDGSDGMAGADQPAGSGLTSTGDPGNEGGYGGGINNLGSLTLTRVVVTGNSAGDGGDGGAGDDGGSGSAGNPGGDSVGGNGAPGGAGGGIFTGFHSTITATDSAITQNSAGQGGAGGAGGAAGDGGGSAPTGGDGGDSVGGDAGFARGGGGIYADQATSIEMTRTTISGNNAGAPGAAGNGGTAGDGGLGTGSASGSGGDSRGGFGSGGGNGGGISTGTSALDLDYSSVTGNHAGAGGAGGNGGNAGTGHASPPGSGGDSIGGNGGGGGVAGGINQAGNALSELTATLIAGNSAGQGGAGGAGGSGGDGGSSSGGTGGSGGWGGASLTNLFGSLGNVTVANNTAGAAGPGGAGGTGPANSEGGDGGFGGSPAGLFLSSSATPLELINLTIAGNTVGAGAAGGDGGTGGTPSDGDSGSAGTVSGVLANGGTVSLRQSIVVGQTGRQTCAGTWSDVESDSVMAFPSDSGCPGGVLDDPLLTALGYHGGPTNTMTLSAGSPAIDAGNDSTCLSTDQRGLSRPEGPHCDLGAIERLLAGGVTGAATGVTATTATLNGSVSHNELGLNHYFDYGKTTAYGSKTPTIPHAPGVPATLTGLQPNTTYHYRLHVFNFDGTTLGADRTFRTLPGPGGGGSGSSGGGGGGTVTKVGLSIRTKSARLDRKGRVKIKVRCNKGSTERCKGTLSLKAKKLKLGSKRFSIAPGKTRSVVVKISRKGRTRIKQRHKLKATASAKAKHAKTARRKLTLKPRKR